MGLSSNHIVRENFVRYIETNQVIIGLRPDNIMHVYFKAKTQIDRNFQHWLLIAYNHITEGNKYPFLVEGGEFVDITKDGQRYAEEIFDEIPIICEAVVVKNTAQLIIVSFFIRFTKINFDIKIFKNHDKAITWCLKKQKAYQQETIENSEQIEN